MNRLGYRRIEAILARASELEVLVVGDLMLDRYITGTVDRISPEAPVPVVRVEAESGAVGGAGNVAANVAGLGARCRVVGCVGRDAAGEELRRALESLGVGTDGLVVTERRPTTVKTRILARRQQVVRFDHETQDDLSEGLSGAVVEAVVRIAPRADVIILEDYNKGVLAPDVIAAALDAGASEEVPTVVDPKRRNFFAFRGATVFKPNAKELADALGEFLHPDDGHWMESVRRRLECENLLLTLGDEGMALQTSEGVSMRLPTVARQVYDVSGAGDTVTATVAVAVAAGASAVEAALLANHAAALEVGKAGVAVVTPAELLHHSRNFSGEGT